MKKIVNKRNYIIFATVVLIMSLIVSEICFRSVWEGILFTVFQIGGILLPGRVCLYFLDINSRGYLEKIGFSYCVGYCLNIFIYFIIMVLRVAKFTSWIVGGIAIICTAFYYLKICDSHDEENVSLDWIVVSIFGGIMFLISLFTYCGSNLIPPVVQENDIKNDMLYWIGNSIELTRNFPPHDFRDVSLNYNYHYFSSLQLAFASLSTGISCVKLGIGYSVVQSVILRTFGGYVLLKRITVKKKTLIFGLILLFFSTGFESLAIVTTVFHQYECCFGTEYGTGLLLFSLILLIDIYYQENFTVKKMVSVVIMLFVLLGTKAPYGCVFLTGLGVLCICDLFKKRFARGMIIGIIALVVFGVTYLVFLRVSGYSHGMNSIQNEPIYKTYLSDTYNSVLEFWGIRQSVVSPFVFFFIYCFLSSPISFAGVVYCIINAIEKKNWHSIDSAFLAMYFIGAGLTFCITMSGSSNMYFIMASIPVAIVWMMLHFDETAEEFVERMKVRRTWIYIIIYIIGFVSVYCFIFTNYHNFFQNDFVKGARNILGKKNEVTEMAGYYIDDDEMEAYSWLRENTDIDTIITSNKYGRAVGVFSEKYVRHGGPESKLFASVSNEEKIQAINDYLVEGISHVLYVHRFNPDFSMPSEVDYEVVFENEKCSVYKICQ